MNTETALERLMFQSDIVIGSDVIEEIYFRS